MSTSRIALVAKGQQIADTPGMRYLTTLLLGGSILLGVASIAEARTLRVPQRFGTIQAAVDASRPGDKIVISSGTYVEDVEVSLASRLTIIGKSGSVLLPLGVSSGITFDSCDRVTLKGLKILDALQGAITASGCTRITIKRCEILAAGVWGIQVSDCVRARVLRNQVLGGTPGEAIVVMHSERTLVSRNTVEFRGGTGIRVTAPLHEKNVVRGNYVSASGNGGIEFDSSFGKVLSNTVVGTAGTGIRVKGTGVSIVSNTITTSLGTGIFITPSTDHAQLHRNVIRETTNESGGTAAVEIHGTAVVAEDNVVEESSRTAILLGGSENTLKRSHISGADRGSGIQMSGSANTAVSNRITGALYGIAGGGDGDAITKNVIDASTNVGLWISGKNAVWDSNTISNTGNDGVNISGVGHTLIDNSVTNSGDFDLFSNRTKDQNTFSGNSFPRSNISLN